MRFICILLLVFSAGAFAQDTLDVRFLSTQTTAGSPFALPISINAEGEFSLFGKNSTNSLSYNPTLQMGLNRAIIEYSQPVVLNRFNFYPVQKELGWIEVKRFRIEGGLGIASIIQSALTVGLIPYKGSMQTIIRHKTSQLEKSLAFKMPKELNELSMWNEGDLGTFQTYGGILFYAGVSAGIVDIATASIGIQNQFLIEMNKLDNEHVLLKLSEENLKSRRFKAGPFAAYGEFSQFRGRRLSLEFKLDINNPLHHELFKEALNGNLHRLQEELLHTEQHLTWRGQESHYYVGIPAVIGKSKSTGHYDLSEDGIETELSITGTKNKGYLTALRNHQNYVYQSDEGIVVVWTSEMNRVNEKAIEKNFLSKGRIMGIRGFDRDLPDHVKYGSVVSQIGIHVTKAETLGLKNSNLQTVEMILKERCEKERLSCRRERNLKKIMKKVDNLLTRSWEDMREDLGLLMIKEPAVIYAVVKAMKYKKEVYFKFLSEKFQSLEGSSPIEI